MHMIVKRTVFAICLLTVHLLSSHVLKANRQIISAASEHVCRRICCIARLKNLMAYLALLCEGENCSRLVIDTSLLEQWKDFIAFRHINDTDFQTKFLQKIFTATISLLNSYDIIDGHIRSQLYQHFNEESLEDSLAVLDYVADVLLLGENERNKRAFSLQDYYKKHQISGETVTRRFYQIRRLKRADEVLNRLVVEQISLESFQNTEAAVLKIEMLQHQVQDERISDALLSIVESKRLDPLLTVSQELTQFRYVGDEIFFQEMLMSMFTVYKGILLCCVDSEVMRERVGIELDAILEMYEQVDLLSTQELLGGIDMATDHMQLLLDGLNKKRAWMKFARSVPFFTIPVCILAGLTYYWYGG